MESGRAGAPHHHRSMPRFLRDNALSLVLALLFLLVLGGQTVVGRLAYNEDQQAHGDEPVGMVEYVGNGHYLEAVFENWESEFLQMGLYVFLTAFLVQRGSAESKKPESELAPGEQEEIDEDPAAHRHDADAPGPVRRGGLALRLYQNSLSIAFLLLFIASFVGHGIGGALDYNQLLSAQRAEAVVAALTGEYGIDPARLTPAGAGMVAPVATNRTEEGRAANRRVEVVALY